MVNLTQNCINFVQFIKIYGI